MTYHNQPSRTPASTRRAPVFVRVRSSSTFAGATASAISFTLAFVAITALAWWLAPSLFGGG